MSAIALEDGCYRWILPDKLPASHLLLGHRAEDIEVGLAYVLDGAGHPRADQPAFCVRRMQLCPLLSQRCRRAVVTVHILSQAGVEASALHLELVGWLLARLAPYPLELALIKERAKFSEKQITSLLASLRRRHFLFNSN